MAAQALIAQALIAFGGNLGDPRATLTKAVAAFCDGGAVRLLARSSDYRTPPWGVENQPSFINAGIRVETSLAPQDLLARALEVERRFGRDRAHETRWGPRSLDIDLIDYAGVECHGEDLTLPHPRALTRAFVLAPLAEIAPDWRIAGVTVADALKRLDMTGIAKLSGHHPEV